MTLTLKEFIRGNLSIQNGTLVLVEGDQHKIGKFTNKSGGEYTLKSITSDYHWTRSLTPNGAETTTSSVKAEVTYTENGQCEVIDIPSHYEDILAA